MPYLSQILDSKVLDSADEVVGKLVDVVVIPELGEYVPLKFLVIKSKNKKRKNMEYIPYKYVENFSKIEVSLKCLSSKIVYCDEIPEHSISLRKHVLDQQIVDISGARVVRVNDLRIGDFQEKMSVLGVDVSTKGLLRRLNMEWLDIFGKMKVNLIDWRQAQAIHKGLKLDTVANNLKKLHPADLANIIEDLSMRHSSMLVESLDARSAAQVLEETDPDFQKMLIKTLGPKQASQILKQMSTEEVVDLMQMLPKFEVKKYLSELQNSKSAKIKDLFAYSANTAGGLMSLEFLTVSPDWTVSQTIKEIRRLSPQLRSIIYLYVVDNNGIFAGTVSMRGLLLANHKSKMKDLLKNVTSGSILHPHEKIGKIIEVMTKYDLYTTAVVDKKFRLLGVICIDDVMRHLFPHA
ncbi:MAG: CBS domain-containing protein [Candidatus Gracilibacteria bacterium]|jgi:sporulation protein YlmC with PRC-barrel domain